MGSANPAQAGNSNFSAATEVTSSTTAQPAGTDFNADGKADILWRNTTTGQVDIWLITGTAISGDGSPGNAESAWAIVSIGDFNGDGKADILWRQG